MNGNFFPSVVFTLVLTQTFDKNYIIPYIVCAINLML